MRAATRIELTEARPTPLEVLIGSFRHLLETGRPAGRGDIAKRVGSTSAVVEERLRGLEQRRTIRRNEARDVVVAGGLSVAPTVHRMEFVGVSASRAARSMPWGSWARSRPTVSSSRPRRKRALRSASRFGPAVQRRATPFSSMRTTRAAPRSWTSGARR